MPTLKNHYNASIWTILWLSISVPMIDSQYPEKNLTVFFVAISAGDYLARSSFAILFQVVYVFVFSETLPQHTKTTSAFPCCSGSCCLGRFPSHTDETQLVLVTTFGDSFLSHTPNSKYFCGVFCHSLVKTYKCPEREADVVSLPLIQSKFNTFIHF